MNLDTTVQKSDEKAVFALRALYDQYGYSQYKMSKFEEYDLYVRNKDFLISDSVITFTDTNGKLMALKPDVTLSIIKNTGDDPGVSKVYYNENVYRVSKGTHTFREIMQVGLECIGDVDDYCLYEVLMLACKSLKSISPACVLDVSHLGIVSEVVDGLDLASGIKPQVYKCIGEKNLHELTALCDGCEKESVEKLKALVTLCGKPASTLPKLEALLGQSPALTQLGKLTRALEAAGYGDTVRIDFSVIHDMNYYNGVVFKGFLDGIPTGVLSGGQYDKLMRKMGRKAAAVGFAVYMDMLERMAQNEREYDFDALLLYEDDADISAVSAAAEMLTRQGKTVTMQRTVPKKLRFREIYSLRGKEVERIENNA